MAISRTVKNPAVEFSTILLMEGILQVNLQAPPIPPTPSIPLKGPTVDAQNIDNSIIYMRLYIYIYINKYYKKGPLKGPY